MSEHLGIKGKIDYYHFPLGEKWEFTYCKRCKKSLYVKKCLLNRKKFCSKNCKTSFYKGKHISPKTEFKPGKKHVFYRGDNAVKFLKGYNYLHRKIRAKFGRPNYCEFCKSINSKKYSWANITRIYNEDPKNWKRLCQSCHLKFDLGI